MQTAPPLFINIHDGYDYDRSLTLGMERQGQRNQKKKNTS